jgi:predicted nucleic acid-binding protein
MALTHLLDMSAYARAALHPEVAAALDPLVERRQLGRCTMFEAEALYSARSDVAAAQSRLQQSFPPVPTHQADWDRGVEIMVTLAETGRHRAVKIPDLIIAAVAERANLIVLHYDRDFQVIASVTGQPVEAVVPLGSLS